MRSRAKINVSLLILCYLEVVLWTACLFNSCTPEANAGVSYLGRETGNLKWVAGQDQARLPLQQDTLDLLTVAHELHQHFEHLFQQQHFSAWSFLTSDVLQQVFQHQIRALTVVKGLPAPFTGIAAID